MSAFVPRGTTTRVQVRRPEGSRRRGWYVLDDVPCVEGTSCATWEPSCAPSDAAGEGSGRRVALAALRFARAGPEEKLRNDDSWSDGRDGAGSVTNRLAAWRVSAAPVHTVLSSVLPIISPTNLTRVSIRKGPLTQD